VRLQGAAAAIGGCPDGAIASIRDSGRIRWSRALKGRTAAAHDETIDVSPGDAIAFRVDSAVDSSCAAVSWDPRISYLSGPVCWRLVWHDEFNDRESTVPDRSRWRVWDDDQAPCPGCPDPSVSNGRQQDWLADTWQRADNIVVADGVVTIHTRHDGDNRQPFSGGMMDTRGRFEPDGGTPPAVRLEAKTLRSVGDPVHPAFWSLGGSDAVRAYTWDPTEVRTPAALGRGQTFASREFSGTQGGGNWYYEFVNEGGAYRPLEYNPRARRWDNRAAGRYLRVARKYQVPDRGHAAVRAWQAPASGRVRINFAKVELERKDCGDGVRASIRVGPAQPSESADERVEWSRKLERGGRVGWTSRMVTVRQGERVRFRVDPLGGGCYRTAWDPIIEYNPWPARGELDIMEYPPMASAVVGAHTPAFNHTLGNAVTRRIGARSIDPSSWVVSWVDWYPDRLEFYFVESRPGRAAPAEPFLVYDHRGGPGEWPFDHGQYLILHDKIVPRSRNGVDRALPAFPTAFRVDYVRVWEHTCGDPAVDE
jgi:hypothetical protein